MARREHVGACDRVPLLLMALGKSDTASPPQGKAVVVIDIAERTTPR